MRRISRALSLRLRGRNPRWRIAYETYGELNRDKSNAVLVCHALTGSHHAAGFYPGKPKSDGWWNNMIGPGKALDSGKFFILSPNNLGGCHGSSGPNSPHPGDGKPYGPRFPAVTVEDWIRAQRKLARRLGLEKFAAVVGGSLGGMQALRWATDFPAETGAAVVIAAAAKLTALNIAFNDIARQAIRGDPDFNNGEFYGRESGPRKGLAVARMLGHVTYLSDGLMSAKFGRARRGDGARFGYETEFEVESYLRYQGGKFSNVFDANTYMLMTRALDYFDPAAETGGDLARALAPALAEFLVVSFSSDWRFSPARSRELVAAMLAAEKRVSYVEIESDFGHDSFLLNLPRYQDAVAAFMSRLAENLQGGGGGGGMIAAAEAAAARHDFELIASWVEPGSRVLDLGCGDGALLEHLRRTRGVRGVGVDVDGDGVLACLRRGVSVVQGNIERGGLEIFADGAFDYVVLSQTLQSVATPPDGMLRGDAAGRRGGDRVVPEFRALVDAAAVGDGADAGGRASALALARHAECSLLHDCGL